jgi:hypothetical protein
MLEEVPQFNQQEEGIHFRAELHLIPPMRIHWGHRYYTSMENYDQHESWLKYHAKDGFIPKGKVYRSVQGTMQAAALHIIGMRCFSKAT